MVVLPRTEHRSSFFPRRRRRRGGRRGVAAAHRYVAAAAAACLNCACQLLTFVTTSGSFLRAHVHS